MRKITGLLLTAVMSFNAVAISLPSARLPSGSDRVSGSGVTCDSSISPDAYLEVGAYGTQNANDRDYYNSSNSWDNSDANEAGAFVRVVVPIGGPKERLNCGRLYDLEIQRLQYELEILKNQAASGGIGWE